MDKLIAFVETTHTLDYGNGEGRVICTILYRDDIKYHGNEHMVLIYTIAHYN